ncbi:hypothetical protein H2200_007028 [Cladophialophora chaetospira]|uniref:Transcription factor domain-containing protein n=1 Tax=Cladophialophora chaetospira TaxID=386627 RepID=A0AA38X710_9EURO|nr:hypothetical protein H2200_007028 [Cladophialophora chaetospira]
MAELTCQLTHPGVNRGLLCPGYQRPLRWSQKYEKGGGLVSSLSPPPDSTLGRWPSSSFRLFVFDDSAIFVDSYSGILARVLSIYDGLFNPFRATALSNWKRSSLLFSVFRFFAGIYQLGCSSDLKIGVAVDEARLAVLSQLSTSIAGLGTSIAVRQPDVLLVINMFGLSSSWYDLEDMGLEHYAAAATLIRAEHGMKPSRHRFYQEFLVYWWMMLSFASSSDAHNLQEPPTLELRSLAEPRMPHPLTGVSPESQLLLGMVGRLVLTQRRAILEQNMTSTKLPLILTGSIEDARILERRLLSLQFPPAHMIMDPGDTHTSVQDLLNIAQAYRSCGLILLYHAFPDLVKDENLNVVSTDSTTFAVEADRRRQRYLASLAFDVLALLEQTSPTSGTRTIEAILLVIISGELSLNSDTSQLDLEGTTDEPALDSHSTTGSYSFPNWYTPTAALEARATVLARFERIQAILPFKTIRRMRSLVTQTWKMADSGFPTFWPDLLIKNNWQFLMI